MSSPVQPPLTVETVDGATVGRPITRIKVSNGTLTVSGNTATIVTGAGGGGGSGTVTSVNPKADTGTGTAITNVGSFDIKGGTGITTSINTSNEITITADNNGTVTGVTGTAPIVSSGGTTPAISLAASGVTAGSYTSSNITVDAQGRITAASSGSGGGGISWSTPVDANIIPDTDDTYDIGSLTKQFRNAYFDGTVRTDILTVDSTASVSAIITLGGGSYSTPSYAFIDDPDCGMGREDTNAIFLGTGGSPRLKIYSDGAVDLVDSKLKIANSYGSDGQVLTSTGSGIAWETPSGGGGSPGGSTNDMQVNNGGSFEGAGGFEYDTDTTRNSHRHVSIDPTETFSPQNDWSLAVFGDTGSTSTIQGALYASGTFQVFGDSYFLGGFGATKNAIKLFQTNNASNYMAFAPPSTITTSTTLTLPDGDGSTNQFLKTDGSGNLGWATPTASITFPLEGSDGSAATPTYSFSADTDTGIFRVGDNELGFSAFGTQMMKVTATGTQIEESMRTDNGSTVAPSISFISDTSTGIYLPASSQVAFTIGGTRLFDFRKDSSSARFTLRGATPYISCDDASADLSLRSGGSTYGEILISNENSNIEIKPAGSGLVKVSDAYTLPGIVTATDGFVLSCQTDGSTLWDHPHAISGTPSSSTDTGKQGSIQYDSSYFYVCIAANTWRRVALSSW